MIILHHPIRSPTGICRPKCHTKIKDERRGRRGRQGGGGERGRGEERRMQMDEDYALNY